MVDKQIKYDFGDAPEDLRVVIKNNPFFDGVFANTKATGIRLQLMPDHWVDPAVDRRVYKAYRVYFVGLPDSSPINSHNAVVYVERKQGDHWSITTPTQHFSGR